MEPTDHSPRGNTAGSTANEDGTVNAAALRHQVAEGCASFSLNADRDDAQAIRTIQTAWDAGIRIFDTARAYATLDDDLHNEKLVAAAVGDKDDAIVMTKGGHFRVGLQEWDVDNSPTRLRRDVEDSLRALGTERLGVYFVHRADGGLDIDDAFGTLEELRREGKIAAIGISNATSEQIERASHVATLSAVENRLRAGEFSESLACSERLGLAFFAYSPLGGPATAQSLPERFPRVSALARDRGLSPHNVALRGMLEQSPAASVVVGLGSPARATAIAQVADLDWDASAAQAWAADAAELPQREATP